MIGNVIHALSTCDEKIPPCRFCVGSVLLTVVELGGKGEHNISKEGHIEESSSLIMKLTVSRFGPSCHQSLQNRQLVILVSCQSN